MEWTVLPSAMAGALLVVPIVLLAGLCLSCKKHSHTSIPQTYGDYETQQFPTGSGGFRIVRPMGPVLPASTNPINMSGSSGHSSHLLLPVISPLADQSRHPSFALTEDGSIPSYENQELPQGSPVDREDEDVPGYIEVLPDSPACKSISKSQQSLHSQLSSGTDEGPYVNVDPESGKSRIKTEDDAIRHFLAGSRESIDSDDNGSSDYVNAPLQKGH